MKRFLAKETIEKINRRMISGQGPDLAGLPPAVVRQIRDRRYTAAEINDGYAQALRMMARANALSVTVSSEA